MITLDCWDIDAVPVIYIDGSSVAVTEDTAPAGSLQSEYGGETMEGKVKDVRIYNRILSSDEVTALYNAGTPDESLVTDGLVFQGPAGNQKIKGWMAYDPWDDINVGLIALSSIWNDFQENIYGAYGKTINGSET